MSKNYIYLVIWWNVDGSETVEGVYSTLELARFNRPCKGDGQILRRFEVNSDGVYKDFQWEPGAKVGEER